MSVRGCSLRARCYEIGTIPRSKRLSLLSRDWTMMSSSIGKRALVTSTVIAAFVGSGLAAAPEASASTGSTILSIANSYICDTYNWGSAGGRGWNPGHKCNGKWVSGHYDHRFDCSGLIYYSRFGTTNRSKHSWFSTAQKQYDHTTHISSNDRKVGDLVFIGTSPKNIYHVGIYAGWKDGKGWMVNANTGSYRGHQVINAPISEYTSGSPRAYYGRIN